MCPMQVREVKCALHQRYQIRNLGWSPCIIFIFLNHLCTVKVKQHYLTFLINFFCKSAVCMSRQGLCHSIRIFIRILLSDIYCIWQTRTKIYTKTAMMSGHHPPGRNLKDCFFILMNIALDSKFTS